jgi:ankyrin repeat protein
MRNALAKREDETMKTLWFLAMPFVITLSNAAFCGAIHDAAKGGDLEMLKVLVKHDPDLVFSKDDRGETPLHLAAEWSHKDVAEFLLANKADVNAKNNDGRTPLHLAADRGYKEVAELLLKNGADVNAKAKNGETPLHLAALNAPKEKGKELAELLLKNGADVNAKDNAGSTPLQMAVLGHREDVMDLLRQHGGHE